MRSNVHGSGTYTQSKADKMDKQRKAHWETIYRTKRLTEFGWYQPKPNTSIQLIASTGVPKDAKIIDVGGGDSLLAENLIALGYSDITVLDISEEALERARRRMGNQADRVSWICAGAERQTEQNPNH